MLRKKQPGLGIYKCSRPSIMKRYFDVLPQNLKGAIMVESMEGWC